MGGSSYFDVTDASPRLTLPQAPAYNQFTGFARVFFDAYEDWGEVIMLSGASDKIIGVEYEAAGNVYVHSQNIGSPGYAKSNLITGGYRGWANVAVTSDGTSVIGYGQAMQQGAALVSASRAFASDISPTLLEFGGASVFGTDSEGKHAFELIAAWPYALSATDIGKLFASRKREPAVSGAFFWNDCRNGYDITRNMARAPRQGFGGPAVRTGVITTVSLASGAASLPVVDVFQAAGGTSADASSAPTLTGGATGASLAAGAASSAPTLAADATSASLAASAASSAPTLSSDATGASLAAADPSSAPTLTSDATSTSGSDAVSAPTLSAGATGASLAASATSAAPTLSADATSAALKQGAASSAPTLSAAAHSCVQNSKFPLVLSSDSRYLVTATGVPFRIHADSPWEAPSAISLADYRTYLADRVTRGFNALVMQAVDFEEPECVAASNALPFLLNISGTAWDGDPGLVNFDAALSSPNSTYWDHVEAVVGEACSAGVILLLNPFYLGFNFGDEGAYDTLVNAGNTQAVCFAFGQYLGNRFKNYKNIIWVMGGDMTPTAASEGETRLHKILEGIQDAGDTNLVTCHWAPNTVSTDVSAFAADNDIRAVYEYAATPDTSPKYPAVRDAYADATVMPTFLFETRYEAEGGPVTALKLREFMWSCQLSSTEGVCFGHGTIWDFDSGWESVLGSTGAGVMTRMSTFLGAINWQQLVPHGLGSIGTLITAGIGTLGNDDYVNAAASPVGTLLVAYEPHAHTGSFTVDRTKMAGSFNARWFDPTDGSYTTEAGGPFPNTGTQAFTNPGNNAAGAGNTDWVLILETPTSGDASSAPTLNAAATSGGMAASSAPTLSAGATGASLWAAAASSAPTLNANAGGQSNDTPAGGGLWGSDWDAEWDADWYPAYGSES